MKNHQECTFSMVRPHGPSSLPPADTSHATFEVYQFVSEETSNPGTLWHCLDEKIEVLAAENLTVVHDLAGSMLQFDIDMVYVHEALVL